MWWVIYGLAVLAALASRRFIPSFFGLFLSYGLTVAIVADVAALGSGWIRSRSAYTVLALGHDGNRGGMLTAAAYEYRQAYELAVNTYNPVRRWVWFRNEMMWWFVWRRLVKGEQ